VANGAVAQTRWKESTMKPAIIAASALAVGAMLAITGFAALPSAADAPAVSSLSTLMQKELHWGMSHRDVSEEYNKPMGLFDREYAPQLARLQPGVEMDQLSADKDGRKTNFEHSYTEFADSPTGYDVTPLHSEYTYKNGEAIQRLFKDGRTRYFFYIKDRLWKIYDEVPLKSGGVLGDTFRSALLKFGAVLGVQGRIQAGDPARGIERTSADWQDSSTHMRVLDRSAEHLVGLVLEDKQTMLNLTSLRSNKPEDPFALDPSIAALTKRGVTDPNAGKAASADAGRGAGRH
jgi:hypothetical protein